MSQLAHQVNRESGITVTGSDAISVTNLIAQLGSDDGLLRQKARQSLVTKGKTAIQPLIRALGSPNENVRWEAAKALGEIGDPAAANALVQRLEDEDYSVRWLAAEGLIAMGNRALEPLLQALAERSYSAWLREGAHHVLHDLASRGLKRRVQPVLTALEGVEPTAEVPEAALAVLQTTSRSGRKT